MRTDVEENFTLRKAFICKGNIVNYLQLLFMMLLKGHKQRYYKRLFFQHGFCRVQRPTCTICRAHHLKKKMVVETPRLHEEIASGISRHGISRGDQEKIMWNLQGF